MLPHDARSPFMQNPWKPFRNTSGEVVPPYAVMRITGAEDHNHSLRYLIHKPNSDFHTHYLVNGPASVPVDKDGFCTTLSQAGFVAYNSSAGTPAAHEEWGAKSGQWTLEKNRPGFIIDGGEKTTAGVTAVGATQRIVTDLIGKADSSISNGSTGTVSIWMGASGSEAATEYDLTCRARFGAVTGSKWAAIAFRNGVWYVGKMEC